MIHAQDVANVFLRLSEPEVGDTITNLKIQKLVYYAQGFHLALFDSPLFDDHIKAWTHGPVVESLYHEYKQYGSSEIPIPTSPVNRRISKGQIELIQEVNIVYGQFSAWKLRDLTHSERPWVETPQNGIISQDLMKEFFKTKIKN